MAALRGLSALVVLISLGSADAALAELPDPVRAMLDAAIEREDQAALDTIAKFASETNPDDAKEIAEIVADYKQSLAAEQEAEIREAGIFSLWKGSGELGGFITTGNTRSTGISAGLSLQKSGIDWQHKFRAIVDYQRSDGVTTRNQWMASYEPNFRLSEAIYAYGLAMYEKDRFQGFSDRVTASGGVGVRVLREADMKLDLKGGPAWRQTNWLDEPESTEFNTLAGADFLWHLSRSFELKNNTQIIWSSGNSTYNNTAALTAKFNGKLSARVSYAVRHETVPPPGSEPTDTITRATLVYDF